MVFSGIPATTDEFFSLTFSLLLQIGLIACTRIHYTFTFTLTFNFCSCPTLKLDYYHSLSRALQNRDVLMMNLFKLTRLLLLQNAIANNCFLSCLLFLFAFSVLFSPLVAINNSAFSILYPRSAAITSSIGNWRELVVHYSLTSSLFRMS